MKHKKILENKIADLKDFCIENNIPLYLSYMDQIHVHTETVTPEELETVNNVQFDESVKKKYNHILAIALDFRKQDYMYKG